MFASMHTYSVGRTIYRHTLTEYVVLFRNSEESFNKYLSPDPDHVRGNPSHGKPESRVYSLFFVIRKSS